MKHKTLGPEELQRLQTVLDDSDLVRVNKEYGLLYLVADSWMEWDIRVPQASHVVEIKVRNFSPAPLNGNQPYPFAVLKLGCSISNLRNDVYGDAQFGVDDCKKALDLSWTHPRPHVR